MGLNLVSDSQANTLIGKIAKRISESRCEELTPQQLENLLNTFREETVEYSVKDITQSLRSVPFKGNTMTLSFVGVTTTTAKEEGSEPVVVETPVSVDIEVEENTTNDTRTDEGNYEWNGVKVPYSVDCLGRQQTPLYFYNPNDTEVTIGVLKSGSSSYTSNPQYSLDGETWTTLGNTTTTAKTFKVPAKSYVMVKNTKTETKWSDANNYNYFTADKEVHIGGNIASLLLPTFDTAGTIVLAKNYSFYGCFTRMTTLTDASDLLLDFISPKSATEASNTYAQLFDGCTNLVAAPKLPAMSLSANMYAGMFRNCTSLVDAPELPATQLTSGCYFNMFDGCSSLRSMNVKFTSEPSTTYTNNWLNGVAEEGVFIKSPEAKWEVVGNSGVPVGWTIMNYDDSALYTFGIISDWHYGSADGDRTTNKATFVRPEVISSFYKAQNVDLMTLDGDLTYNGKVTELTKFKNMVADQFRDIPFYYNQGNHDAVCTDANYKSTMGVEKNFVTIKGQDVFIFASQDYTSSRISDDTNDVAYKQSVAWILETLEKYKGYRIFLYIHYCFYNMAGAAPGVSYGFKNGSTIAKSIVDKVKEVGNIIVFTGHTHFSMERDQEGDGYVHTQELGNNAWMVHIPSCGWCKSGNGKGEDNCIKDPYPEDTKYGKIYRSQGYVAEAYPDRVVLKSYEFNTGRWLDYTFNITGITNKAGSSLVEEGSKDPVVPAGDDFVVLESVYVNSANWQTDYNTTATDTLEWKGSFTKTSQYLMGTADSAASKRFDVQYTSKNQVQVGMGTNSYKNGTQNLLDGNPHTLTFNSSQCKVDGKVIATNTSLVYSQPSAPIRICGIAGPSYSADIAHLYIGRFYEASVYDADGNAKHHWVPVYTKEGEYKLYDTISETFIDKSSSGEVSWKD